MMLLCFRKWSNLNILALLCHGNCYPQEKPLVSGGENPVIWWVIYNIATVNRTEEQLWGLHVHLSFPIGVPANEPFFWISDSSFSLAPGWFWKCVFEKSQRIRKVSKCENQFIGRKMSKHWRNQGIKWTSNINNQRSLPPSGVILQCFCLSLHAPILQQQWTRFTEVFTSWNQPRDVHTGSSWAGESLPFSQWLSPGLAGTGLSTAV